jgi:hypothetical protein
MNPSFRKLLGKKRRRERDPNAPPPPTLLGQVKELRLTKDDITQALVAINNLSARLDRAEAHTRRLESTVRDLENYIRSRIK